ncbi:LysR family transcriptional regulator [Cohaesibacter celericrescens]|uniref:HTH lysR-type domain-containing protein n=1 Tax=Cohaesibacter celericrescens TaxID=2067669 RepID=A0A2N5XVH3_9HYPH|nr:LysR family transcriptional regulator [Cohaesibacter celericrescens]PLW78494.1 hypothetical protein C0081_04185 [Cohaesibacter celericrescens]
MDTNWLTDFLVLSKTGSFSQAAEDRFITQSAFSRRIKALETWLGADLFDRSSYPVSLTPEGLAFHDTAQNILRELQLNRLDFQRRNTSSAPDIRLAAATTLALSFVPEWLKQIKAKCGSFSVSIDTYDFYEMIEMLSDGKMDMVLLYYHPQVPAFFEQHEFDSINLGKDVMHLCNVLDENGEPEFDLDNPPKGGLEYVGYGQTGYFSKIEDLIFSRMTKHDPKFVSTSQSGTCEFIKRLAVMEKKMLWLPACSAHDAVRSGQLALAGGGKYDLDLDIWVYKKRDAASPLIKKIWSSLLDDPCISHLDQFQLT